MQVIYLAFHLSEGFRNFSKSKFNFPCCRTSYAQKMEGGHNMDRIVGLVTVEGGINQ